MIDAQLIVVGSGLYGLTVARRAAESGIKVCVLERRSHIGGNAYSEIHPETGIEVHKYGSHLFHCNSEEVWDFVNRFSAFTDYRHHVFTQAKGKVYPMPINLETISLFLGKSLSPDEAKAWVNEQVSKEKFNQIDNLEDKAISLIGRPLYDAFIRGYTMKQWQTDPRALPPAIITRLPVRFNYNTRYFSDRFEGLPVMGYSGMFTAMIRHENISVMCDTDFFAMRDQLPKDAPIIYTGPLDRFYDFKFGDLGWRTLDFKEEVHPTEDYQGTAVMNYADESVPYTRIHEFQHLHPERKYQGRGTVIYKEYSRFAARQDEPYYPIDTAKDRATYDAYWKLADKEPQVLFGGRLGTYRYLDMHQAIGAALNDFDRIVLPHFRDGKPLKA